MLAREPVAITMHDIMTAAEHQTFEINCETHPVDAERCAPGTSCSIRPVWQALQQRMDDLLSGITLAALMNQESQMQELVTIGPAS